MNPRTLILTGLATIVLVGCGGPTGPAVAPAAPEGVTATAGPGYVDVDWQHDGTDVNGFAVYRDTAPAGAASVASAQGEPIAEVAANARAYRDAGVTLGNGYAYRVAAVGAGGTTSATPQSGPPTWADCATPTDAIAFADTNLEAALRLELDLATEPITCGAMETLTSVIVSGSGIESLAGLQYATNLERLHAFDNAIDHLWPLANSASLDELQLHGNDVADLTPLADLTGLSILIVSDNPIDTIDIVDAFEGLTHFGAARTTIDTIGVLSGKSSLVYLWLNGATEISDFSPLGTLPGLVTLLVGGTQFDDADMVLLDGKTALARLQLWATTVSDLSVLADLDLEYELDLNGSEVSDLTPIHHMTALQRLRAGWLDLSDADIAFLADFTALTFLDLSGNALTSLEMLAAHPALGDGDILDVGNNLLDLNDPSVAADLAALVDRGVQVSFEEQSAD